MASKARDVSRHVQMISAGAGDGGIIIAEIAGSMQILRCLPFHQPNIDKARLLWHFDLHRRSRKACLSIPLIGAYILTFRRQRRGWASLFAQIDIAGDGAGDDLAIAVCACQRGWRPIYYGAADGR